MSEINNAFFTRAQESLVGAVSEIANERYNNAANRSYYACFQAAIFALSRANIRPTGDKSQWTHAMVQSQFTGTLINRRKSYPAGLQDTLLHLARLRIAADYEHTPVTGTQAARALRWAQIVVATIVGITGATP